MPRLDRGTHTIHYDVHGAPDKPPLLLIMGLAFSSPAWSTLPGALEKDYRMILLDNRGTGRSTRSWKPFSIADMADDAAAVLDAVAVRDAHVFGISMGGMIALELALNHRKRVRSLMLGCTYAGWLRSHKPPLSTILEFTAANLRPGGIEIDRVARFMVSLDYFSREPDAFAGWIREVERADALTSLSQLLAVTLHTTESRLQRLDVPTLVITGDDDRLVPPQNSRKLARAIPGARLVELRGAGHCFPVEQLQETVEAVRGFFR